jgi:hypothetical protein
MDKCGQLHALTDSLIHPLVKKKTGTHWVGYGVSPSYSLKLR